MTTVDAVQISCILPTDTSVVMELQVCNGSVFPLSSWDIQSSQFAYFRPLLWFFAPSCLQLLKQCRCLSFQPFTASQNYLKVKIYPSLRSSFWLFCDFEDDFGGWMSRISYTQMKFRFRAKLRNILLWYEILPPPYIIKYWKSKSINSYKPKLLKIVETGG